MKVKVKSAKNELNLLYDYQTQSQHGFQPIKMKKRNEMILISFNDQNRYCKTHQFISESILKQVLAS